MLDHTGINVSDFARSREFYQAALAPLRYQILKETPSGAGFGVVQGYGKCLDPAGTTSGGLPHAVSGARAMIGAADAQSGEAVKHR
jgi:catechol 2,3-dioxygenase-like lactoylglutathione lyase family enzyme